jgi:hypothetical protein
LRQALLDANRRAKQRANRRSNSPEPSRPRTNRRDQQANRRSDQKQDQKSIKAAISETYDNEEIQHPFSQRLLRWFMALLLLPFCVITTMALFHVTDAESGTTQTFWTDLFKTRHFLFFTVGMFLMGGWFFTGLLERVFLYLYVLGHELTHAIFVFLCGGRVSGMSVSVDGGYIMTNKTNVIIALSPYFVPFWSVIVLLCSTIIALFISVPYHTEILYFLIGGTWAFHLLWTLWMIPRDQPDLQENGVIFSIVVIYLANVIVLSVLLCLAPGNLTWHHWANQFLDAGAYLHDLTLKTLKSR